MAGDGVEASEAPRVRRGSSYQVDVSQLPVVRLKPAQGIRWKPAVHEDDAYWQRRDRFSKSIPVTEGTAQTLWPDYSIGCRTWSTDEEKDFVLGIFMFEKNFKPISRFIGDGQQKNFIQCRWYYYNRFKRALSPLYQAFKLSSVHHSKEQHVRGSLMVLGNRGRKLLTRLFSHITDAKVQERIAEAHSKMARNEMSLEKFVRLLRKHSSSGTLWSAFAIGEEEDLSSCHHHLYAEKVTKHSRLVAASKYRSCTNLEIQEELAQMDIRAAPTSQMSDLFHMGVWPRLERLGWHLETVQKGNGRNMVYYCCPALPRFSKGAQRGLEYFDASRALLTYVAHNLSVLDERPETPMDRFASDSQPQYQGVERRGTRWRAYLMFEPEDGQSELVELGEFASAERAAAAHDIAALKYIGQLAPRNFTHDFEQDEGLARMSAPEVAAWLAEQALLPPTPPAPPPITTLRSPHPFSPPITPRPGALSGSFSPCLADPLKSPRMQRPAPLSLSQLLRVAADAAGQQGARHSLASMDEVASPSALHLTLVRRLGGGRPSSAVSLSRLAVERAWTEVQAGASLVAAAVAGAPEATTSPMQLSHQMAAISLAVPTAADDNGEESKGGSITEAVTHEGDPHHWWMQGYLEARAAMDRKREGTPEIDDEGDISRRLWRKGNEGVDTCLDCDLDFDSAQQLAGHRAGHARFKCRTCGKGFDTLHALGGHQKTHQPAHRAKLQKDDQEADVKGDGFSARAPGPSWLQCPTCLDWFKNGHALGGHQRVHGGQQFPPMKGIRSGSKPPPEINVFLLNSDVMPAPRSPAAGEGEEFDDEEVLGEIVYRNPDDNSGDEDGFGSGGHRRLGRPRGKKSGKYACRKCGATFPTSRGRDGHQRMHGPSAGAVLRRGASVEQTARRAGDAEWGSQSMAVEGAVSMMHENGTQGEQPPSREVPAEWVSAIDGALADMGEERGAAAAEEAMDHPATPPDAMVAEALPFTAARSRRTRKPRRFESFEWQTEWRREEKGDETAPATAAEAGRSGSDGDMESSGSETERQVFACNECTAAFASARSLGSHRKLHRSERRRRLEELRAMSEDPAEGGAEARTGASVSRALYDQQVKPVRPLQVGREVYGGCILPNGRYQCNTCFKDFGTGQALGGHQRIHSGNPAAAAKKKAPKALTKPRKRAPAPYLPIHARYSTFARPHSASGSRCVVPGQTAWRNEIEEDEKERPRDNERGWHTMNLAEESPAGGSGAATQWGKQQTGGDSSECCDSAELLMAFHFQQQEKEREREQITGGRASSRMLAASPLGVQARQWGTSPRSEQQQQQQQQTQQHTHADDVGMTAASPLGRETTPAAPPLARASSAEWAENVPIGRSAVFFPTGAAAQAWPGGEKRKRVLSQFPGASSPETSPAASPQAAVAPSRFHSTHWPAAHRPTTLTSPGGAGLSRYGAQALYMQQGTHPYPRFLSTLPKATTTTTTTQPSAKATSGRPHQCHECGAEFETGAALGGHVGKHRRENEREAREKEGHATAVDSPGRDALRASLSGVSRVGMSLTPRGGNVKAATARHQAPKKRIMVKFQAQQQQRPTALLPSYHPLLHVAPPPPPMIQRVGPPGGPALQRLAASALPHQGVPAVSQMTLVKPAPLRLTVQVATSPRLETHLDRAVPARLLRSPSSTRDYGPTAGYVAGSPDPTPRTRDVAILLQGWHARGTGSASGAREAVGSARRDAALQATTSSAPRNYAPPAVAQQVAMRALHKPAGAFVPVLTLPNGKPDPEAPMPRVLSPGNVNTAIRAPMTAIGGEPGKQPQLKSASPTRALSTAERSPLARDARCTNLKATPRIDSADDERARLLLRQI